MGGMWADLATLLRSAGLGVGVPAVIWRAEADAIRYAHDYELFVAPLVDKTVSDPAVRARVHASLRSYSVKASFVIHAYAAMTAVAYAAPVAALGLAVTRLYDDLLDEVDNQRLDERLTGLFRDDHFESLTELEQLLRVLYDEIQRRIARPRTDPFYAAVLAVHGAQIESHCQRRPGVDLETIRRVTYAKGAAATLTVFALMRADMAPAEQDLIRRLGEVVQLLDDYQDARLDQQVGVHTRATEGDLELAEIGERLRRARAEMRAFYGRSQSRPLIGVFYLIMWISFLRRRWPELGTSIRLLSDQSAAHPLGVLVLPGNNIVISADMRSRR